MESYDISVVVSTRNRANTLQRLLGTLQRQRLNGATLEVIIINNGSTDDTETVLARDWGLNLVRLQEPVAGKSRALNRALQQIRGRFIVFTDDDITAPVEWLLSFLHAQQRYPAATAFCGPIIPKFPPGTPTWLPQHSTTPARGALFGRFIPDLPEGPLPLLVTPHGANFAAQASALKTLRFQPELGPSKENGLMMGEDTEFVIRLRAQGEEMVYVPDAFVEHWIRPDQVQSSWMFARAFYVGRARVAIHKTPKMEVMAAWQKTENLEPTEAMEFARGFILNFCCGQIHQLRAEGNEKLESELASKVRDLAIPAYVKLLAPPAREALALHSAEYSASHS